MRWDYSLLENWWSEFCILVQKSCAWAPSESWKIIWAPLQSLGQRMSPPGPEGISLRPLCQKIILENLCTEWEWSIQRNGILSTKFSVFRDRKPYAILGNAERSKTLVGSMEYQESIWELKKSEHFLINLHGNVEYPCLAVQAAVWSVFNMLGGNVSGPNQLTTSVPVIYSFFYFSWSS